MIVSLLIGLILGAGLIFGAVFVVRAQLAAQSGSAVQDAVAAVETVAKKAQSETAYARSYASANLMGQLRSQLTTIRGELETETGKLKSIEQKLDSAQKDVEQRETDHQELKTAKEEDDAKAAALLADYSGLSTEAVTLEQKLASSMKNLDQILGEIELTQDQRNVLTELSDSLMNAGSRLRDLLTEYKQVNDRLEMLRQQHIDLEEEYTRLVEQQLGE